MSVEIEEVVLPGGVKQLRPTPQLDPAWPRIERLQWRAGVIKARTGVTVTFDDELKTDTASWPQVVGIHVLSDSYHSSSVVRDHEHEIDMVLTGIEVGAAAAQPRRGYDSWQRQDVSQLRAGA
jgi:hypothetical protein